MLVTIRTGLVLALSLFLMLLSSNVCENHKSGSAFPIYCRVVGKRRRRNWPSAEAQTLMILDYAFFGLPTLSAIAIQAPHPCVLNLTSVCYGQLPVDSGHSLANY